MKFSKGHKFYPGGEKTWFKKGDKYWLGKTFAEVHKKNISEGHKGQIPWNKGLRGVVKFNDITKDRMSSNDNKGWFKRGHSIAPRGQNCHFWRGGITPLTKKIRECSKYFCWRDDCFKRDNYTCQECGKKGGRIEVNHIIPFSFIFRFYGIKTLQEALDCLDFWNLDNGETLCEQCHKTLRSNRSKYSNVLNLQRTI
jgi:5-methylcytosine-specific restriction endonuclease McrA